MTKQCNQHLCVTFVRFAMTLLIVFSAGISSADAPAQKNYSKVEIYFLGWSREIPHRIGIHRVIEWRDVYLAFDEGLFANSFVQWMDLDTMQENPAKEGSDPRLVIRLTQKDGATEVFYGGGNFLYSEDSSRRKEMSPEFKEYFSNLIKFLPGSPK